MYQYIRTQSPYKNTKECEHCLVISKGFGTYLKTAHYNIIILLKCIAFILGWHKCLLASKEYKIQVDCKRIINDIYF